MISEMIAIGLGGFIGACLRYFVSKKISANWKHSFPLGTFVVNLTGSFLLGWIVPMPYHLMQLLLGTGVMGALTTFSTFMVEANKLTRAGDKRASMAYLLLSTVSGLVLAYLGYLAGIQTFVAKH